MTTNIAIVGYGNIGRGIYQSIQRNPDMQLEAIITRRPQSVGEELPERVMRIVHADNFYRAHASGHFNNVDVAILCGGSKNDLPQQEPFYAQFFNTVDSFDTHNHIGPYLDDKTLKKRDGYLTDVESTAEKTGHTSVVSIGWDPGTFSMERILAESFILGAKAYAFYGLTKRGGLSMGHSDAIRTTVKGVKDARSYTHTVPEAIERVRTGGQPNLSPGDMHWRECVVALKKDIIEERERVAEQISMMPDYFKDYKTTFEFVTQEELDKEHSAMPHDGLVLAVGETSPGNKAVIEYKNTWDSNPEATANIMVAYARAIHRLSQEGRKGALTIADIPAAYVSLRPRAELVQLI